MKGGYIVKKKMLWLWLIIACLLTVTQPADAFDPGAWLTRGIMKLDSRAAEASARNENARKDFAAGKIHNNTVKRVKKYLKSETVKNKKLNR